MSHWTEQRCELDDIDTLEKSAIELGCTVLRNAKARGWGSDTKVSDLVIQIPDGRYDIAVNRKDDGTLSVEGDMYDGSIKRLLGDDRGGMAKLFDMYGIVKCEAVAKRKRIRTKRISSKAGRMQLEVYV